MALDHVLWQRTEVLSVVSLSVVMILGILVWPWLWSGKVGRDLLTNEVLMNNLLSFKLWADFLGNRLRMFRVLFGLQEVDLCDLHALVLLVAAFCAWIHASEHHFLLDLAVVRDVRAKWERLVVSDVGGDVSLVEFSSHWVVLAPNWTYRPGCWSERLVIANRELGRLRMVGGCFLRKLFIRAGLFVWLCH